MSGGDIDKTSAKTASPASSRESRLAEALRANLRRRKAAPSPASPSPQDSPVGDADKDKT